MVKRYKCLKGLPCDRHISSKNYYRLSLKAHRMPERCLTHWCSEKVNCQPYITGLSSLDIVLIFVVVRCSVTQSYPTLCNPVDWSKPGVPVVHHLPIWALSSSNSCPLSQWCHPTISSSVAPLSSCPQSFPASESFPMSQVFAPGGQSIKYWYFLYYSSHHEKLNSNQQHTSNKQSRELKESCHMVTVTKTEATRMIELRWSRKALLVVQSRILEWVAMPSSRGPSWLRNQTRVASPALAGGFFTTSATWEAQNIHIWNRDQH